MPVAAIVSRQPAPRVLPVCLWRHRHVRHIVLSLPVVVAAPVALRRGRASGGISLRGSSHLAPPPPLAARANTARENGYHNEATYDGTHRYNNGLVVAKKLHKRTEAVGALTLASVTLAASIAGCTVEEVLLHDHAGRLAKVVVSELWRSAGQFAALRVTCVCLVVGKQSSHHGATLQIPRCTLSRSAREARAARAAGITIGGLLILGTFC